MAEAPIDLFGRSLSGRVIREDEEDRDDPSGFGPYPCPALLVIVAEDDSLPFGKRDENSRFQERSKARIGGNL